MTKPRFSNPRSKVRGRPDGKTLSASIPQAIVLAMRLQPGDWVEWVWITEGYDSYCKLRKVQA